jgi:hypothetical protein
MTDLQITIYLDWRKTGDSYKVLSERHAININQVVTAVTKGLNNRKPKKKQKDKPRPDTFPQEI